jgi:hypothetical protein
MALLIHGQHSASVRVLKIDQTCAQWWVHSPGGGGQMLRPNCFNSARITAPVQERSPRRRQLPRAGPINTPAAINSRISRLPFLNSRLLDPAERTLDASKRSKIACGTFGGTPGRQAKGRNGRVSGDAVKILRLPKYSADGLARKQRGGFTGCTFWRCGVEDSRTTSKNTEPSHLTPGSLREYANQSECERKPILPRPHRVNKPAVR